MPEVNIVGLKSKELRSLITSFQDVFAAVHCTDRTVTRSESQGFRSVAFRLQAEVQRRSDSPSFPQRYRVAFRGEPGHGGRRRSLRLDGGVHRCAGRLDGTNRNSGLPNSDHKALLQCSSLFSAPRRLALAPDRRVALGQVQRCRRDALGDDHRGHLYGWRGDLRPAGGGT